MPRAVVIGAGPGGTTAALALRAGGWGVTIVESRVFPRAKVCGEFVSPAATGALERWLSPAELVSAGARRVDTLVLELGGRSARWTMPRPAWVLSRRGLDALLLDRALASGAAVRHPATASRVRYGDGGVAVELGDGATPLDEAAKCALVSMDSTLKSNLSVGLPLDLLVYRAGELRSDRHVCVDEGNPYFQMIRGTWGQRLREVFESIEDPRWDGGDAAHPGLRLFIEILIVECFRIGLCFH